MNSFSSPQPLGKEIRIITTQDMVNRLVVILAENHEWVCDNTDEECFEREECQCDSCEGYRIFQQIRSQIDEF